MTKQLSDVLKLSLQELALRKVAIVLWKGSHSLVSIRNFHFKSICYCDYQKYWCENVECKVSDKISKLQLPETSTKQLRQILKPIGLEILRWKKYHEDYLNDSSEVFEYFDVPILEKLCFTAVGTVDYRKTAEELVRCNVIDILKRYKLACLYCLDHYISEFWNELPQEKRIYFYSEDEDDRLHIKIPLLQFCWPYIIKGEEYKLVGMPESSSREPNVFYQHIFTYSSFAGNKTAVKYFFQKLSLEKREACIVNAVRHALGTGVGELNNYPWRFPKENVSEVVCYLLSLMTPEQQTLIFSLRPADVLGCFLDWPWQDAFLDTAEAMWTWMQCDDLERRARNYNNLLNKMERKIQNFDYCLPNLYQKFFLRSSSDFRKYFVDRECYYGTFFNELFNIQDTETINLILKIVDPEDRMRLALSKYTFERFYHFISIDQGHVVEMCIRETGLSKEDKKRMKEAFMQSLKRRDNEQIELGTPKWIRFFEFLDETNPNIQSKRSPDDETLTETKKLCCEKEGNSN
ncbi:unnamed protein product [Larinioides sclopetarius]|uniref:Uncharacterized protein n=1 Tax=Larinioides sclopetarius TaxID=280406 RepID=A0AAV2AQ44_9ARAC